MEIYITDKDELAKLKEIADNNHISSEQYATNIVRTWLNKYMREKYIKYVKTAEISDLKIKLPDVRLAPKDKEE